jgi:hypothetical protein
MSEWGSSEEPAGRNVINVFMHALQARDECAVETEVLFTEWLYEQRVGSRFGEFAGSEAELKFMAVKAERKYSFCFVQIDVDKLVVFGRNGVSVICDLFPGDSKVRWCLGKLPSCFDRGYGVAEGDALFTEALSGGLEVRTGSVIVCFGVGRLVLEGDLCGDTLEVLLAGVRRCEREWAHKCLEEREDVAHSTRDRLGMSVCSDRRCQCFNGEECEECRNNAVRGTSVPRLLWVFF